MRLTITTMNDIGLGWDPEKQGRLGRTRGEGEEEENYRYKYSCSFVK